jgi:cytochrome c oxidase accessory protein FixG
MSVDTVIDAEHDTFRNELASVSPDGKRRWVYARKPSGRFYRWRTRLSWFLLAFLFLAPFVRVNGLPLMMFNVIERKFVFFGLLFWPQDFYMVVLIALSVLVTLMLSTVTIGRVWCGWLCPQTIFMEMLFRKIEFAIDGSAEQQVRRARGAWTGARITRAVVKLAIFYALSFAIANVFLAYIIGSDALWSIITDPPSQHVVGLTVIVIFSFVFFLVFARFREQACVLACPYGRVMSSLIDRHTVTVTYDFKRGEPRGRLATTHEVETPHGDCIDCHQCVTVCPTGIDIRNGVQLECVNCTACIDACDQVMRRVERPTGLIRLTSHEAVSEGRLHWLTVRSGAYAAVWVCLVTAVTWIVASRPVIEVTTLRQPGTLFASLDAGRVGNFYNVQVFNRTGETMPFEIRVVEPAGATVTPLGLDFEVGPHALLEGRMLVAVPRAALGTRQSVPVRLEVRAAGEVIQDLSSAFIGPPAGGPSPDRGAASSGGQP